MKEPKIFHSMDKLIFVEFFLTKIEVNQTGLHNTQQQHTLFILTFFLFNLNFFFKYAKFSVAKELKNGNHLLINANLIRRSIHILPKKLLCLTVFRLGNTHLTSSEF